MCSHLNKNSKQQPADLYLTIQNTTDRHPLNLWDFFFFSKRHFIRPIVEGERPQTYALDRAATGTGQRLRNYQVQFEY